MFNAMADDCDDNRLDNQCGWQNCGGLWNCGNVVTVSDERIDGLSCV